MARWQISRRTFLRGVGSAMALPMLDAMVPSMQRAARAAGAEATSAGATAAASALPRRMAFLYVPNGKNMVDWTPATAGTDYQLTSILQPLAAHRKDFTLISGMAHMQEAAMGDGGGGHARAAGAFLTAHHPRKTSGSNIQSAISVDQVAANAVGDQTRLRSLELTCDKGMSSGQCESGYSCTYQFNLSWKSATEPMTPEVDPKQVFSRLFGADANSAAAKRRDHYNQSILDTVMEDARALQGNLGATDKRKMDEYLSSVREIELRIARDRAFAIAQPDPAQVPVIPEDYNYEQLVRLHFDLIALAFQTDTTRITSFILGHDGSNRPYPQVGVNDGHHDLSHHRGDEEKKKLLAKINTYHTTQLAYFLAKLKSIKEGDGNLLDNSMIVYGSGLSEGNDHLYTNLPILLAGRGGGTLRPGAHLRVKDETPVANLYVSLLQRMGVTADRFGDSTGRLAELG